METRDRFQDDTNDDDTLMMGGARPVLEFVSDDVTTLLPTTSLREAAVALRRDDVSFAAVGVGAAIEGVISERDLVDAIAMGLDIDETAIEIVESDSLKWATATSTVDDVAEEMLETYVRHILVCNEDGTLAGVVSMRDLLTAYRV
jgi:CBS domain-containing protein